MSEFLIVTGLSGAGRSQGAVTLEDLGWFVVDNLPATLIPTIAELAAAPGSTIGRVALVVGRGPEPGDVLPALVAPAGRADTGCASCSSTRRPTSWFAATAALVAVTRSLTRRGRSTEAIERERLLFEPVKADADVVVDTGDLNVHQLRDRLLAIFGGEAPAPGMQTTIRSFGYKHGLPLDADMVHRLPVPPEPVLGRGPSPASRVSTSRSAPS